MYGDILKDRLKDVDQQIRNKYCNLLTFILCNISEDMLTTDELEHVFTPLLESRHKDNKQLAIENLEKLYSDKYIKMKTPLLRYGETLLGRLANEALHNDDLAADCIALMNTMRELSPDLSLQSPVKFCCDVLKTSNKKCNEQLLDLFYGSQFPEYRRKIQGFGILSIPDRTFMSSHITLKTDAKNI